LKPTSFKQTNLVFTKPEDMTDEQCDQLAVYRHEDPQNPFLISCWKLDDKDIETILRTRKVWVQHCGNYLQPLALFTEHPFGE
jgi:hypothetical protein